ncbi:T9SS type A sorting domain-containing protein [Fibrella aquatica]|uniref:T9SS type A sorting domain-containing protein n=1 Tax=Fibrella aquatica TaxID=3242487 RepID=UPI003522CEED
MKHLSTCLFLLNWLLLSPLVKAQDPVSPSRIRWTAPLSASIVKTVVDAWGNTWALSAPNTFQVFDPLGNTRWTKAVSTLSVADFTIDAQGQLLLVGLPTTGAPVLEKYDATQTLAWRNGLDSLSNVPGQAANLSVTVNPLGSGLVLGLNARSDQKLSYYFFTAGGQVSMPVSVTGTKPAPVSAIRPVLVNTNDMMFGIHQPQLADASPLYFRVQAGPTQATLVPLEPLSSPSRYALTLKNAPFPPAMQRSLPLLSDGKDAWAIIRATLDTTGSPTAASGYVLYPFRQNTFSPSLYATEDIKSVGEAASQFLDSKGRFFTTQILSNTATSTASADLLLNQYTFDETGIKPLLLISSLKVGTVVQPTSTSSLSQINRLTMLNRNSDGSVVLTGTTSGTMTIGSARFTGSAAAPVQFLVSVAPETTAQTLTAEQIGWTSTLPTTVRRVITNGRKQTWVQLPDSMYRHYDPAGRLVWEKKLVTQGIFDMGADLKGNLYIMSNDSVNTFDSTGAFRWKLFYKQGVGGYNRKMFIKPTGGGVVTLITDYFNGKQRTTEFTDDGKEVGQIATWDWAGHTRVSYTLVNLVPLSSKQMAWFFVADRSPGLSYTQFPFVFNNGTTQPFVDGVLKWKSYSIPNIDPNYTYDNRPLAVAGYHRWSKAAINAVYLFQSQNAYLPATQQTVTYGYSLTKFDSTGNTVFDEVNTIRVNRLVMAKSVALSPASTLFTLTTSSRLETAATTSYNLVLNQHDPDLNLRNTTQLGTFTLVNGQTDKTSWALVDAYADGSVLLSGITSGTLTIGANTFTGSPSTPARFLTLIQSTVGLAIAPSTPVCARENATLNGIRVRYKGYISEVPVVDLYALNNTLVTSASLPLRVGTVVDTTVTVALPISTTLGPGVHQLRTRMGTIVSDWVSMSIAISPSPLEASLQRGELVAEGYAATYQWYDAQQNPVQTATSARFRPMKAGGYYVTGFADGCTSNPSNTVNYVIPNTARLVASATSACAGTTVVISGRYQGYFEQPPVVQLTDAVGASVIPQTSVTVPLALSSTTSDTVTITTPIVIPANLTTGTYGVRILSTAPEITTAPIALSVNAALAKPVVTQEGDELVGAGSAGSYQWYNTQNNPVAGAIDPRFKPQSSGSYYVINTLNGCVSPASTPIVFVITATEPAFTVDVYPNPTTDKLLVRWPQAGANARISLLTVEGRMLMNVPRQGELSTLPTNDLADGLLLVQLQAEGQPTVVRRVLIRK